MNTIVFMQRGGIILRNCLFSLRSLPKNIKSKIPCLVGMPNTRINIVNCEFMGNDYNMTSGCVFIYSDVVMSSCKFMSFRSGAIYTVSNDEGDVEIKDCEVTKCGLVGIYT